MRRFCLAALLAATLFLPVAASAYGGGYQTPPAPGAGAPAQNYGGLSCPQHVPCPEDTISSSSDLVANATACVKQYMGMRSKEGFFEEGSSLDSNNCLATKPEAAQHMANVATIPHCCIIKLKSGECTFRCEVLSAQ